MSNNWKKVKENLRKKADAMKAAAADAAADAASEAKKGSNTDKKSAVVLDVLIAPSPMPSRSSRHRGSNTDKKSAVVPALSTPSTSRSRTGGTDPVGLLAAHGCQVQVVQAPVSNIIRKPWLKKMPDIVAKKEAERARAALCPLSRSPPEGNISHDTSESFSSGTDSGLGSDSDSSSSNNSSNTTVILQDPKIAILEADPEE
jgi:hypothetical protein